MVLYLRYLRLTMLSPLSNETEHFMRPMMFLSPTSNFAMRALVFTAQLFFDCPSKMGHGKGIHVCLSQLALDSQGKIDEAVQGCCLESTMP